MAKKIVDKEEKTFVLSGILVFADKIIDTETAKYIKEVVRMTQVAELLLLHDLLFVIFSKEHTFHLRSCLSSKNKKGGEYGTGTDDL